MTYNKKGQAALEFLMTYGWAILVVLAAIGALAYFGVLNPAKFAPETCMATSGWGCQGKAVVDSTTLVVTVANGLGYRVNLNSSVAGGGAVGTQYNLSAPVLSTCTGSAYLCPAGDITCVTQNVAVEDSSSITIRLTGCDFANANAVKGDITLYFQNTQSKLMEKAIISVTAKK